MPSARRVRWAQIRVASVAIVALVILGVLISLITGGTLFQAKAKLYLYIPDATGLAKGSPVRVDGVDIGVVESVGFSGSTDPSQIIRVRMSVEKSRLRSINADSVAQISNDTLIGDKFVDISSGSSPAHIPENGALRFKAQPDLMRTVDLEQLEQELRLVDGTLGDIEAGRTQLGKFVIGDEVYASMRRRLTELQNTLRRATATNSELGNLIYTDALYQKIRSPLTRLDEQIAYIQSGQGGLGQLLRDPAQFEQLRATLLDLQKSITATRTADFIQSDDSYVSWTKTLTSLADQVDAINQSRMLNATDLYEEWDGSLRQIQATMSEFHRNPAKYMRVQIF